MDYKICTRCVMDTVSDPNISFDKGGICNYCTEYFEKLNKPHYKGNLELEQIIERIKKKGKDRDFDCVMGVSGGVDSSYSVYLAKQYGLRVLLVHLDNGWDTEISVKNIRTLASKLDFKYVSYVLDWEEFREIQLAFLRSSIVDLEMPTDIAIAASVQETAAKYNIKYLVSGGNMTGEGILPLHWGYHVLKDQKLYNHIVKKFSKVKRKKIPALGLSRDFYFKFIKNIRTIYLLSYVEYDKDKAKQYLIDELDWEDYGGKHHESKITAFWHSYAMPVKYKMDYRRVTFSSQICEGHVERSYALEQLKTLPYDETKIEGDKDYIAKKFGIDRPELDSILNEKPKIFTDFPNNKDFIEKVYKMYLNLFPNKRL